MEFINNTAIIYMSNIKLQARLRNRVGKKGRAFLDFKNIPAVIYGPKSKNRNLEIGRAEFNRALEISGQSSLVDVYIGEENPVKAIINDVARDPLSGNVIHADFYELDMNKKLKIDVELNFIGESPAVKEKGAELIKNLDRIEVECLPKDLVPEIDVDISSLQEIGDHIFTKDIILPTGLEFVTQPGLAVASVEEIKEEIIMEPQAAVAGQTSEDKKKDEDGDGVEQNKVKTDEDKNKGKE